tara:strand:- start:71608 stop:71844 length:237 start_codon:yes stop_codon:yes gene_type:complete
MNSTGGLPSVIFDGLIRCSNERGAVVILRYKSEPFLKIGTKYGHLLFLVVQGSEKAIEPKYYIKNVEAIPGIFVVPIA